MDEWQDAWDKLNRKLSDLCSDGVITEEEMESELDKCQTMRPDQLIQYWSEQWEEKW